MWVQPECGQCSAVATYAQLTPTVFHCTNNDCDHEVTIPDFVAITDWKVEDGILSVFDPSL